MFPKIVQVYKRLLFRLPKDERIYLEIEKRVKAAEAGYSGERYVDNFLKQVNFPKHYAILKDIHIQIDQNNYLQIDTLILTRKYIAILEIKNIRGKIYFQKNPAQLIREVDGETTPFKCPEQQLKRHTKKLQSLIQASKIDIPMKGLIVLAYSKTHVVLPPKYSTIVMGCDIHEYLDNYNKLPDTISIAKFNQLVNSLKIKSIEFIPKPIAQTFPLEISHIKTGLFCPNCCIQIKNQSKCPTCKIPKIVMQRQAIEDWFYLAKDTISNNECVFFLGLKDKFAANYLLNKLELHPINHHKSRYYVLQKVSNVKSTTR